MEKCIILIILSILAFSCKKDKFPSTPTKITGKVVDQNNIPIEGYEFQFNGLNKTGLLTYSSTFNIFALSNREGIFEFSQVVPSNSDEVAFKPVGLKYANGNYNSLYSDIYLVINGKNIDSGAAGPINYGTTNTFNYQVIIRKPESK